jgi:hypothetical protein
MTQLALEEIAAALVSEGKGILAATSVRSPWRAPTGSA